MTRSIWKGPFVDGYLIDKVQKIIISGKKGIIKTWSRRSTILPIFVGMIFSVYNGNKFIPVSITEEMVGRKLGEFAPTRIFHGHNADKRIKRK